MLIERERLQLGVERARLEQAAPATAAPSPAPASVARDASPARSGVSDGAAAARAAALQEQLNSERRAHAAELRHLEAQVRAAGACNRV